MTSWITRNGAVADQEAAAPPLGWRLLPLVLLLNAKELIPSPCSYDHTWWLGIGGLTTAGIEAIKFHLMSGDTEEVFVGIFKIAASGEF